MWAWGGHTHIHGQLPETLRAPGQEEDEEKDNEGEDEEEEDEQEEEE